MKHQYHFETRAIHAGQEPDATTGAVIVPIYQTSTYVQEDIGVHKGYEYSRTGNPTRTALEQCLASLEEGEHGLAFASGMAAIDTVLRLLPAPWPVGQDRLTDRPEEPGDHILAGNDLYGGTYRLFQRVLAKYGFSFSYVDMADLTAVEDGLQSNTRLIWLETPTNPWLKIVDIAAIARLARERGIWTVVDNTFATPFFQRPLSLGADIVVHSTTKYLGGHSDVVGGAVVTHDLDIHERLKFLQNAVGAVPGPFDCWLVLRGVKTLAVRMKAHEANALEVARFLEGHPKVERVLYPGLPNHPQHELARRQMSGFGGMVSFVVKGGREAARRVVTGTRLFALAESLGGVESLIEHPASMTHASVKDSPLAVDEGLVRLSVGIEDVEDLLEDLATALERV